MSQNFPSSDFWNNLDHSERVDAYFSYIDRPEKEALRKLHICVNFLDKSADKVIITDALSVNRFYPVTMSDTDLWNAEEELAAKSSSSEELTSNLIKYFKDLIKV